MNKILLRITGVFVFSAVLLTSCKRDDYMADHYANMENPVVTQAKEFFENQIEEGATKGTLNQTQSWAPGEVTPRWEDAYLKIFGDLTYVYVPIYAENRFYAKERALRDSLEKIYQVRVTQLLVFRHLPDGSMDAAYFTLVPSKGYYTANKNNLYEKFIKNEGYYGNFSGRVIYNDIVTFNLQGVDKIIDGQFDWGFSAWTVPSEESFWRNYRKMFKNVTIHKSYSTKSAGEDDEDDEEKESNGKSNSNEGNDSGDGNESGDGDSGDGGETPLDGGTMDPIEKGGDKNNGVAAPAAAEWSVRAADPP